MPCSSHVHRNVWLGSLVEHCNIVCCLFGHVLPIAIDLIFLQNHRKSFTVLQNHREPSTVLQNYREHCVAEPLRAFHCVAESSRAFHCVAEPSRAFHCVAEPSRAFHCVAEPLRDSPAMEGYDRAGSSKAVQAAGAVVS